MSWCNPHWLIHCLQVFICNGKERVEEVETKIFRLGTSVSVHIRHVQLPGEETRSNGNDASRRIYRRLLWTDRRWVEILKYGGLRIELPWMLKQFVILKTWSLSSKFDIQMYYKTSFNIYFYDVGKRLWWTEMTLSKSSF